MSAPLIWFGNAAKFLKSAFVLPGSTSGAITVQSPATVTSYSVSLPSAQGAASTVLTNDGAGNLTWSPVGSNVQSFSFANNQTSFANITGFLLNPATNPVFVAETSTIRTTNPSSVFNPAFDTSFFANTGTGASGIQILSTYVQPSSGTILLGGGFSSFDGNSLAGIYALNSDGTADSAFNTNLGTGISGGSFTIVHGIAAQSTGQIIVVGDFSSFNGNTRHGIFRLNTDGTEDATFATNIGTGATGIIECVTILSDDTIVIGGTLTAFNGNLVGKIAKLSSAGVFDSTFNTNINGGANSTVNTLARDSSDNIYVGGTFTSLAGNSINRAARVSNVGVYDSAYNSNLGSGFNSDVYKIYIQPSDGKAVVGSNATTFNGNTRNYLVRLNTDGTEDTAFYTNLGSAFNNPIHAIIQDSSNNLDIGGNFTSFNGNTRNDFVQLASSGIENASYYTSYISPGFNSEIDSFALTSDGSLLVGGQFSTFQSSTVNGIAKIGFTQIIPGSDLISQDTIKGVYHSSTGVWTITNSNSLGDVTGLTFQMTNAGQLQYKSSSLPGTVILNQFKFLIEAL